MYVLCSLLQCIRSAAGTLTAWQGLGLKAQMHYILYQCRHIRVDV